MSEFEFIVVGAGTAGCVLAARLSEDAGVRVLLVEAGSAERTRAMSVPDAWPQNLGSAADWADTTTAQAEAGPVIFPRGRGLGGSGAINALAHVRGHRSVYDGWAAGGAAGWAFSDLLPYLRRCEDAPGRDAALRGSGGPIRVGPVPAAGRHRVAVAFAGALAGLGCPVTDDLSGAVQEGVAWVDLAIAGGQRVSSADGYLRPVLGRPNLTVQAGCLVTGLLTEGGRCAGVSYVRGGQAGQARAAGEVVVCAGAVGSPQLLLLSGIGPAGQLRGLGIGVVTDLPGVGANLQDHALVLASYAGQAAATSPLAGLVRAEVWPGPEVRTGAGLRTYIRRTVSSYYHPAGSCPIGTGPGAVVGPGLRVHGITGLRVADASVMPVIPNAHPNATVLAIAERAADLISAGS